MKKLFFLIAASFFLTSVDAQITERERPAEWQHLVKGARFMDRFLPMPDGIQIKGIWGTDSVLNRYVDNGIELPGVSFWGGNILQDTDGKYHLFVCGWPEDSPKGHMFWSNSTVFHAVSDRLEGPFKIQNSVGKGHNPEAFQLKDGRVVVYVIDGYYIADGVDSKVWTYGKFSFDSRDRKIIEGLSNLTFARRQDDSYLMVCRGGGVWISKDGLSPYMQLTDKRVYPDVEGRFEDPVVWRDELQYHLIVNDWLGRIAFYQRSKDGVHWVTEQGEAYVPGVSFHKDGAVEHWFKYERPKVFQDEKGRAVQMNFAVIDTIKWNDLPNDKHSSKNISIPLNKGMLLARMNMLLHGIKFSNFRIENGDTLEADAFGDTQFDAVVANPPFSAEWSAADKFNNDDRFSKAGRLAPRKTADYAFILHMIYHLNEGGTMACVAPHGVLFRGNAEGVIRRFLIEKKNYVDAIIGLPANIFYGTSIPTCILVFKKCRKEDDNILFIDASKEFEKVKTQNKLRPQHIKKIVDTYCERKEIEKYSHLATLQEVAENDYNLNIPRYVDTFEEEEPIDIHAVMKEIKELEAKRADLDKEIEGYLKELGLVE